MAKTAIEIDKENQLQLDRNPSTDFTGLPNMAAQTGWKTISEEIRDFEKAGRAIMIANHDRAGEPIDGLPAYPDPIEAKILEMEVNADIIIARKRLAEDQAREAQALAERQEFNNKELERYRLLEQQAQKGEQKPPA